MSERAKGVVKTEAQKNNPVKKAQNTDVTHSVNSPFDSIRSLHRTIGNRAVQRLFESGAIQAKLQISQPGDVYEQEADRVAEQVMRMPEPVLSSPRDNSAILPPSFRSFSNIKPNLQRQPLRDDQDDELLQAKEAGNGSKSIIDADISSQIAGLKGGGQPLSHTERSFFEPRFGYDFSGVRLHNNSRAVNTARGVNARAFTIGRDVVFGAGEYMPGTMAGKKLLAHELTHVVQQNYETFRIQRKDYTMERYNPTMRLCGLNLLFDGITLTMKNDHTYTYSAVSGKPNESGKFDYSRERQKKENIGPIPEGVYWINPSELGENLWYKLRLTSSWGNYWITIHPFTSTNVGPRGGFFIHGGSIPGSAGCIDLTSNMNKFVEDLKKELGEKINCQIHLTVRYQSEKKKEKKR